MTPKKKKAKKPKVDPNRELRELRETVSALQEKAAKAEEYLDLAKRTKADFLNYQDRAKREKDTLVRYAAEGFVREFLPALDALRESVRSAQNGAEVASFLQGIELMEKEFLRVLSKNGINAIDAVGKPFDPNFHEALSVVEQDDAEPDTVVAEIRRGWMLHDRVLRPAQVQIARPPQKPDAGQAEDKTEKEVR